MIYHLYNSDSEDEEQARVALIKKQEEKKRFEYLITLCINTSIISGFIIKENTFNYSFC